MSGENLDGLIVGAADAGGRTQRVPVDWIRNSNGYLLSNSATGTVSPLPGVSTGKLVLTAALSGALAVPLPAGVPDGFVLGICNGTGSAFAATITVSTTDGSTIGNGATAVNLGAGASAEWMFSASPPVWYKVQ